MLTDVEVVPSLQEEINCWDKLIIPWCSFTARTSTMYRSWIMFFSMKMARNFEHEEILSLNVRMAAMVHMFWLKGYLTCTTKEQFNQQAFSVTQLWKNVKQRRAYETNFLGVPYFAKILKDKFKGNAMRWNSIFIFIASQQAVASREYPGMCLRVISILPHRERHPSVPFYWQAIGSTESICLLSSPVLN